MKAKKNRSNAANAMLVIAISFITLSSFTLNLFWNSLKTLNLSQYLRDKAFTSCQSRMVQIFHKTIACGMKEQLRADKAFIV